MAANTPEGKVKKFVKDYMKKHFPEAYFYSPPGGAFGKAGTPDHFYLYKGVFIAIEIKAPNGKLSVLQEKTLKQLAECGAVAAVVKGNDLDKMDKIRSAINTKLNMVNQ